MCLKTIQSLEYRLAAGDTSVCFYEMMQETYNLIGEKHSINKCAIRLKDNLSYDFIVTGICQLINEGHGINKAIRIMDGCSNRLYEKLTYEQKLLIKLTKTNYTIKKQQLNL
jgi:hypothetical protein